MNRSLNVIVINFCALFVGYAPTAMACPADGIWPATAEWVCKINKDMHARMQSRGMSFSQSMTLITNEDRIKTLRRSFRPLDGEVCRRYSPQQVNLALQRILNQQKLTSSGQLHKSEAMVREIQAANPLVSMQLCELQQLIESPNTAHYEQFYYFYFGAARKGKHMLLKVKTSWPVN